MGTRNNPGDFDCYENAEPDEPMFVLLGRDPVAGAVVMVWAWFRLRLGLNRMNDPQIAEATKCADAMDSWTRAKGRVKQHSMAARCFAWLMNLIAVRPIEEPFGEEGERPGSRV